MKRRRFISIHFILSILLLAACGTASPGESSSGSEGEKKSLEQPPDVSIQLAQQEIPHVKGTYCWKNESQGICVDKAGSVELTKDMEPTKVEKGETIRLSFQDLKPDDLHMTVWNNGEEKEQYEGQYEITVPTEEGVYVYDVFARWKDKGDQAYAFKVIVK
ncbi:hypothetical protein [Pseudalkalibacillus sp. SCS-8]|uniref:hypothetical protein n=1 Tax=Pseudalkalibacillus nanhaiensis TaxID=3115291 RepID=UPI0032D9C9A5